MTDDSQNFCEVIGAGGKPLCARPAVLRYAALGGGYMHLCAEHGQPHERHCERWVNGAWQARESPEAVDAVARTAGRVTGRDRAPKDFSDPTSEPGR